MSRLSTHILDISRGYPAGQVLITLSRLSAPDNWSQVQQGKTNENGRLAFEEAGELAPGTYKLHFHIQDYFNPLGITSIFPFIEVVIAVTGPGSLHIPLLLSPFGYSTYRGS